MSLPNRWLSRSSLVFALLLGAPASRSLALASEPARGDPIEGMWFGEIGSPADRVAFGLEIKRNEKQELKAFVYQPVANFYSFELPGSLEREGEAYSIKAFGMTFVRSDDKLDGTITSLKLPLSLTRTTTLPSDPPVPELPNGPGPLWRTKLGAPIYAPVATKGGIAYIGTTGGVFQALRVKDGSFAWTFNAGRPIHGAAFVSSDAVYFVCDNGFLFKLNREDGKEIWRYDLGDTRVERVLPHAQVFEYDYQGPRPLLADGVVYVGAADGGVHAVNDSTGQRLWRFEASGKIRSDATLNGNQVLVTTQGNFAYAIDREKGTELWKKDLRAPITSSPVAIDGKIHVGTRGAVLYALDPADATVLWRQMFWGSWVESTPVPFDGRCYVGSSDMRRIVCYNPQDGSIVWRTDVFGCPWGTPVVTDQYVFVGAIGSDPYLIRHRGGMLALERSSGKIAWRWPAPESAALQTGFAGGPAIDGDIVVIGSLDGSVYAFPAKQ